MKRESIAGSLVRVLRWRVVKQISQFANCEHRYADNTRLALPPADVGRTAVERRPYWENGRLVRSMDGLCTAHATDETSVVPVAAARMAARHAAVAGRPPYRAARRDA